MFEDDSRVALIKAPLAGQLVPLSDVPDPVFAQKIVGDGISIDPITSRLVAPGDGVVAQLHRAGHAITITTDAGLDVLMHIGLDTVTLQGRGFTPLVAVGQRVRTGDPLIEFDADFVATHAKSLLTQVTVTAAGGDIRLEPSHADSVAGGDTILRVFLNSTATGATHVPGPRAVSKPVRVPNPTGLHARPAAVLATLARRFGADVRLRVRDREVNAKSVVSIMSAEIDHGDDIIVIAEGEAADDAVAAVAAAVGEGLGEPGAIVAPAAAPASRRAAEIARAARRDSVDANVLVGVAAASGVAIGRVVQFRQAEIPVPDRAGSKEEERGRLDSAISRAKRQLDELRGRLRGEADYGKAAIFAAQEDMLADPDLLDRAAEGIARGEAAAIAWRAAFEAHAQRLSRLKNELLAARAQDVRDVGRRVLNSILGRDEGRRFPADTIVVAEELTPSDVASFDRTRVLGFATTAGGASSHVAILARSFDLPAIAAVEARALAVSDGTLAILDGTRGLLTLSPTSEVVAQIRERTEARAERQRLNLAEAHVPAVTLDGRRIEVAANAGEVSEAVKAASVGADGIGLLRTELLFMDRVTAPTEDEQADAYRAIVQALGPERTTIIRTLDVGGDKPLAYLPIPKEDNPFLGLRGLRAGLEHPDVLRTQLRAILRASTAGPVGAARVMFPMVATLGEVRQARAMLDQASGELGIGAIPVGIMVEVPSVAVMASQFAAEVDFFSIGSNDLTQYALAMDRGHPSLAAQVDSLHPAVLRLIDMTVRAAHDRGKWVGVCGGMASDAQAIPILVGLGVDELSVSVPAVAAVKAQIRSLSFDTCRDLAARALEAREATEVRALCPAVE